MDVIQSRLQIQLSDGLVIRCVLSHFSNSRANGNEELCSDPWIYFLAVNTLVLASFYVALDSAK